MRSTHRKLAALAVASTIAVSGVVVAQTMSSPASGMGPGMMGGGATMMGQGNSAPALAAANGPAVSGSYGMGPGMMGGGYGMGPGMMGGGYGMGPGMMGDGYGMGPGMMGGGYGMGPGMMGGGYGMGPGMMGGAWGALTPDQQVKMGTITRDVRRRADEIAERAFAQTNRMREIQLAPQRDSKALSDAYRKLLDLRQQRFDLMLGWRDQFDQVLAEAQKEVPKR